jgi:hypothetical protein
MRCDAVANRRKKGIVLILYVRRGGCIHLAAVIFSFDISIVTRQECKIGFIRFAIVQYLISRKKESCKSLGIDIFQFVARPQKSL